VKRSRTILFLKNIPYSAKEADIREYLERYGVVKRLMFSPFNTLGIVEYEGEKQAKNAIKKLQNTVIKNLPLYLEYAPIGVKIEEGGDSQKVQEDT